MNGKSKTQNRESLFTFLFGNDEKKEYSLSLYNALNGTYYNDTDNLEVYTIDDIVYIRMPNDVAFMVKAEKKKTENCPDRPYRMLEHICDLYQEIFEDNGYDDMLSLPATNFVILYNGASPAPEYETQRLSDMYEDATNADFDLSVRVYNINGRYNRKLIENCKVLSDYMWLVEAARSKSFFKVSAKAISNILNEMPDTFEIKPFLLSEQKDVLEMILEDYALENAERYFDAGVEKGSCKEKIAIARRMEKKNMPVEEIAEYTDLKIDEVEKILHD